MKNRDNRPEGGNGSSSIKSRQFRVGTYSIAATLIVIAIAIAINFFVSKVPTAYTNIDVTGNKLYALSEQSKEIVSSLEQPLTIYWITETGAEDSMIGNLLDRYDVLSSGIKIEKVDPLLNPKFSEQYTSETVYANSLILVSGERSTYVDYFDIYVYDLSTYQYDGQYTVDFDGENAITGAIDFLTSETLPTLYYLTGHSESEMSETLTKAITKENIVLTELNLVTSGSVPEDASCILINGPASDISIVEKELLLGYLKNGGNLLLVSDYVVADYPNLTEVMEYYGVSPIGGLIMDTDTSHSALGTIYFLLPDMASHAITDPLIEHSYMVISPLAHGIEIMESIRGGLTVQSLLTTSSQSYLKLGGVESTSLDYEEGDLTGPLNVGVVATDNAGAENESRVVWYSASSMLSDTANDIVSGGNQDLFINSIGWLCDKESSISIHSKSLTAELLTVPSSTVTQLGILLVGAVPLVFIVMGIIVFVRRKRK